MPVTNFNLERFGPFDNVTFPFSPGVNVVLGANSTGKTFAIKALYALLKALGPGAQPGVADKEAVRSKLAGVFRPDDNDVRRLVKRLHGKSTARLRLEFDDHEAIRASISTGGSQVISHLTTPTTQIESAALFVPSREVLAMYEGFVAAYQRRELSFDETYYDLAVALSASALRGPRPAKLKAVAGSLERELGGAIRLEGPRFYLQGDTGKLEAHLLAEGLRKVGSLVHLIANGELRRGGVLIWDEPEANLHPRLAEVVVDCLGVLAEGGVQVIVTTHDYLIADAISRWSEYRNAVERSAPVRFFQLTRNDGGNVTLEVRDQFAQIEQNPLLDAFLRHHDAEQELIAKSLTAPRRR